MHDKHHFQRKLVIIFQKSNQLGLIVVVYLHSFCHLDLDLFLQMVDLCISFKKPHHFFFSQNGPKLRLVVFLEEFECSELCFPRPKRGTGQGGIGKTTSSGNMDIFVVELSMGHWRHFVAITKTFLGDYPISGMSRTLISIFWSNDRW